MAAALVLAACTDGPEAAAPAVSSGAERPAAFTRHGVPGPWWRAAATEIDFDRDVRACLGESRRARAGVGDPADAAYRAFLDCMGGRSWRRGGTPPPSAPLAPAG
jgi:hypothetical protein